MKPDKFNELLDDYARQELPLAPAHIRAGVWSEIARRKKESFWFRVVPILEWRELFGEPRLVVPAFALALVVGILPALTQARAAAQPDLVRQSLHFDVFSAHSASLPATLLTSNPATRRSR